LLAERGVASGRGALDAGACAERDGPAGWIVAVVLSVSVVFQGTSAEGAQISLS
jgi:hypothetical protein